MFSIDAVPALSVLWTAGANTKPQIGNTQIRKTQMMTIIATETMKKGEDKGLSGIGRKFATATLGAEQTA